MSLAHFVYIPGLLMVGAVIGYILGGRAAVSARSEGIEKSRRRDARRARREAGQPRIKDP